MRLGFDLDGTLDHAHIRQLAATAHSEGHEIHVITGYVPGTAYGKTDKLAKLARLGVLYTQMHLCEGFTMAQIGAAKADVINRLGISDMWDDDATFVAVMRSRTKAQVHRVGS